MSEQQDITPRRRELYLRLASAAVLIPIGLLSVWQGGFLLALICALAAAAMAFEYGRMAGSRVTGLMIVVAGGTNLVFLFSHILAGALLLGGGALAAALEQRDGGRFTTFFGCLYAGGLALALLCLRGLPNVGFALTMGIMLASWASDTSAYFVGRALGGPLLAPNDSPNKTWSGAIGAVIGTSFAGMLFSIMIGASVLAWMLAGCCISIAAQFGDLFESQIKRRHGVKDTSGILPGHGGVMDRLDGFGGAILAAFLAISAFPQLAVILKGG